jgi:hypothetical protein
MFEQKKIQLAAPKMGGCKMGKDIPCLPLLAGEGVVLERRPKVLDICRR